jgi:hypothetical protein
MTSANWSGFTISYKESHDKMLKLGLLVFKQCTLIVALWEGYSGMFVIAVSLLSSKTR